MKKRKQRNVLEEDGLPWIRRGGQLWGTYDVCSEYIGCSRSSFPAFIWRHGIKTIKHGRLTLASKKDLDLKSGTVHEVSPSSSKQFLRRARR